MSAPNHKLSRLLQTMSVDELDSFSVYLASPWLNRSQKAQELFAYLRPWFPMEEQEAEIKAAQRAHALDKTSLFAAMFPDQAYKESKISNLMTTLGKLIEQFWVWQHMKANQMQQQRALLWELSRRPGLEDDFHRAWQKVMKQWKKQASDDPGQWFLTLELYERMLSFQNTHQARSQQNLLAESLDHLRRFVLLLNLKYLLAALNRQRLVSEELDISLQQHLLTYLNEHPKLAQRPPLRLYIHLIRCLQHPEEALHFTELNRHFESDIEQLSETEARQMYYLVLNYLNGRLKRGQSEVLAELFAFYRAAWERGLMYSEGYLDGNIYLNILNVVSGLIRQLEEGKEKEALKAWREHFLHQEAQRLLPTKQAGIYQYAQAYMHYQQAEFSEAYQILTNFRDPDLISDISRRLLLIRVYFEAGDPDLFDAQVKSALMYISRAEAVSEPKRLAYNRFVRLSRRLFALDGKAGQAEKISAIQTEVLSPEPLECRQWLQETCERMLTAS